MRSTTQDQDFLGQTLTSAIIDFTFDQSARTYDHDIGATHTGADGKVTTFRVQILDDIRRTAFVQGLGAAIQADFEAQCDIVFERRDTNAPGSHDTPDRHQNARKAAVLGFWDTSRSDTLVFILAKWSWKDADGTAHIDGWAPNQEQTA